MERGRHREPLVAADVQQKYSNCSQTDPSTSTATDGTENEASRGSEAESSSKPPSSSGCSPRCRQQGISSEAVLRLFEDSSETGWGEEDSAAPSFSLCTSSPPPKRKRLSHSTILQACRGPGTAEYVKVGITRTYSDLDTSLPTTEKYLEQGSGSEAPLTTELSEPPTVSSPSRPHRKYKVLHNVAMVLTFVAIVSLWGIVDVSVEVASGVNSGYQFQLYGMLLFIGVLAALVLRKLKALSYRWTSFPTLLASFLTAAAAWGIVDVAIEIAAGEDNARRLLYYFLGFLVASFLVAMHVALIDRSFSTVVQGFI